MTIFRTSCITIFSPQTLHFRLNHRKEAIARQNHYQFKNVGWLVQTSEIFRGPNPEFPYFIILNWSPMRGVSFKDNLF